MQVSDAIHAKKKKCTSFLIKNFLSRFTLLLARFICRSTSGILEGNPEFFPEHGLVLDGTPCGTNLVCVNQTCVSIFPYIDTSKCPTNHKSIECSGNGVSHTHSSHSFIHFFDKLISYFFLYKYK